MQKENHNRPIAELKGTLDHVYSNAHLEAYEHPESKNLYLFITEEGLEEIKDIREQQKITIDVHIMYELLAGCSTSCFIGNGFSIEGAGDDGCPFVLCYDADHSECPSELEDDGVKWGRVWEYTNIYTGDMLRDIKNDGYTVLGYTYEETWNTHDARKEKDNDV